MCNTLSEMISFCVILLVVVNMTYSMSVYNAIASYNQFQDTLQLVMLSLDSHAYEKKLIQSLIGETSFFSILEVGQDGC